MTRHELREQTFKMLFSLGFHSGENRESFLYNYLDETCELSLSEEEEAEVVGRVMDIDEHIPELDSDINKVSEGWRTDRMGRAELNILRLALYELKYDEDIPVGVAINEAVELSKEYASAESAAFINGVLAGLVKQLGL